MKHNRASARKHAKEETITIRRLRSDERTEGSIGVDYRRKRMGKREKCRGECMEEAGDGVSATWGRRPQMTIVRGDSESEERGGKGT